MSYKTRETNPVVYLFCPTNRRNISLFNQNNICITTCFYFAQGLLHSAQCVLYNVSVMKTQSVVSQKDKFHLSGH